MQPEHVRYWRGYRLWARDKATWPEIQQMTLDEVDLQCLMLDAIDDAEEALIERRRERNG